MKRVTYHRPLAASADTARTNRRARSFGLAAALALLLPALSVASAQADPAILSAPNSPTALDWAVFQLEVTNAPVTNECSIDGQPYARCGFWKRYDNLSSGRHQFSVRRKLTSGSYTTPTIHSWRVRGSTPQPETEALCYQEGNGAGRGLIYWAASNSTGSKYIMVMGSGPTRGVNLIASIPGFGDLGDPITLFQPGLTSPFPVPGSSRRPPRWLLTQTNGGLLTRYFATPYAPCFRVLPPPFVVDNGNGTSSATFAWINHNFFPVQSPVRLKSNASWSGLWIVKTNPLRLKITPVGPGGYNQFSVSSAPTSSAGAPITFPAAATGSWTYTWQNSSPPSTLQWEVTGSSAGITIQGTPVCTRQTTGQAPSILQNLDCPGGTMPPTNTQPPYIVTVPAPSPKIEFKRPSTKQPPFSDVGGKPGGNTKIKVTNWALGNRKTVRIGKTIRLRAEARNIGSNDASNLKLCDLVPKGMKLVGSPSHRTKKGRRYCWRAKRLGAGSGVLGEITLRATSKTKPGLKRNRVTLTAGNAELSRAWTRFVVLPRTAVEPTFTG